MTTKLLWAIGSISVLSLASLQGCGDDADDGDDTTGGTAGTAGTAGKGGSSGKGGSGGTNGGAGETGGGGEPSGGGGEPAAAGTTGGGGEPAAGGMPGAGGGGGDERQTACADYCNVYFDACENDTNNDYQNEGACVTTCVESDWALEGAAGDTIECRTIHANNASNPGNTEQETEQHCGHAAADPTAVCN